MKTTDATFWKKILQIFIQMKNQKEFCNLLIGIIVNGFNANGGFVYLLDKKRGLLKLFASFNAYPDLIEKLSFPVNEGLTGWIVRTGETLVFEKACYRDDRFKLIDKLAEESYEAYLGAPLKTTVIFLVQFQLKNKAV
jgi:Signal transduction protein containing GAF and PtsI domains